MHPGRTNSPLGATRQAQRLAGTSSADDDTFAQLERRFAYLPRRLRFADPAIERAFRVDHRRRSRAFFRAGMLASILGWTLGWVGLALVYGDIPPLTTALILGVGYPVLVAGMILSFRDGWERFIPAYGMAGNALAGILMMVIGLVEIDNLPITVGAMIIIMFFGFVIFHLRAWQGALTVLSYLVPFQAVLIYRAYRGIDTDESLGVATTLIWVAASIGVFMGVVLEIVSRHSFKQAAIIATQRRVIAHEKERADALLRNTLPHAVVERLKRKPGIIADRATEATISFVDLVGFTELAASLPPERVVEVLDAVFSCFDAIADKWGVEKIKTIGDSYMLAAGVPDARPDHAEAVAHAALEMREALTDLDVGLDEALQVRIGIHTGPLVAGVIGKRRFAYDVWGDTVNMASRMESHGLPGQIQVGEATRDALRDRFTFEPRGSIEIKGRGPIRTWLLRSPVSPE